MNAVSSTHLPPAAAATPGLGTREAPAPDGASANAASSATSAARRRHPVPVTPPPSMTLFAQPHLDVPGRAHVLADVATDALVVIGVHVAARRRLLLRHPRHRRLRTIDDAVVALEALAAAHAALGFGDRLGLGQRLQPLLEVAERRFLGQGDDLPLDAPREAELA